MQNLPPHTVSADYIVGRLLQLWRADCPVTLSYSPANIMGDLEFDKEAAQDRLAHLKLKPSGEYDTADLQHKLDTINEYLTLGKSLEAVLTDAIEARRQGKDTGVFTIVLRAEENDPDQYQDGYFTTKCIYDWAMDQFGIDVPEWSPTQQSTEVIVDEAPSSGAKASKYTDLEKEKHEVIIALLLEELATALKGKFLENGRPNYAQTGERIATKCAADSVQISGLSKEKLRKKFSDAMKTKARYIHS